MPDALVLRTRKSFAAALLLLGLAMPGVCAQDVPDIQVNVEKREGRFIVEAYGRLPVAVATAWAMGIAPELIAAGLQSWGQHYAQAALQ